MVRNKFLLANEKVAEMLIQKGVTIDVADKDRNTPLHLAAFNRKLETNIQKQ